MRVGDLYWPEWPLSLSLRNWSATSGAQIPGRAPIIFKGCRSTLLEPTRQITIIGRVQSLTPTIMAHGAAKRIGTIPYIMATWRWFLKAWILLAQQNEQALRNLKLGMFIPTLLSTLLRLLFRRSSLPPSKGSLAIYIVTYLPALFLSRYLERMGTSRRDPTTGALISPGEDLNQPGVTEWCFDILYVTCELVLLV